MDGSTLKRTAYERAIDSHQYDIPGTSVDIEGANARMIQYWSYIRPHAPAWVGKRVLDVGCGDGWLLHNVRGTGASAVLGIEPSENNRALSRARYEELTILPETFESFRADPESFDVITALMSLGHIPDLDGFFRKANNLLVKGGQIIAVVPDFDHFRRPRQNYVLDIQELSEGQYAVAVTRPSGTIADIVRNVSVYADSAALNGFDLLDKTPMPPADAFLRVVPQYEDPTRHAITQLLRFQKK